MNALVKRLSLGTGLLVLTLAVGRCSPMAASISKFGISVPSIKTASSSPEQISYFTELDGIETQNDTGYDAAVQTPGLFELELPSDRFQIFKETGETEFDVDASAFPTRGRGIFELALHNEDVTPLEKSFRTALERRTLSTWALRVVFDQSSPEALAESQAAWKSVQDHLVNVRVRMWSE
jgi:hypothetical protein